MTAIAASTAVPRQRPLPLRGLRADQAAAWVLGFAPVVYLGMSGGGYDIIARSEVGLLIWWLVLLGALIGVLPRTRPSGVAWVAVALLAGFLTWTWIAAGWSQSEERTLAEAARVATYLGVFALGVALINRATVRPLLYGLACSVTLVSFLAVLSRLVPAWYPANSVAHIYATSRLEYPFDYADAVGEFAALGLPLLLFVATDARTLTGRALGAAAVPIVVLCLGLTVSRGGLLSTVVGVALFLALAPRRLPLIATSLTAAAGSTVVMFALLQRSAVRNGVAGPSAAGQRHAMLVVLVLACAGVGVAQAGVALLASRRLAERSRISRRAAVIAAALVVAALAGGAAAFVASGADNNLWQEFKRPNVPASGNQYFRLFSVAGSHRYQFWKVALDAFDAHPWKGIGPGTFEFYWAQHNSLGEFVRNAHSLYIETLADSGIIGLSLIGGFVLFVLVAGAVRSLRAPPATRLLLVTGVAGFAAFAAAASFDWVWQIGVIPIAAMLMAAVAVAGMRDEPRDLAGERSRRPQFVAARVLLAGGFAAALIAIAIPLTSTSAVRSSQAAARAGDYRAALKDALSAQRIEPSAATPRLQRALVLEATGDLEGATRAIGEAEAREATNWRIWLVASRLAVRTGHPQQALADYRRARSLNPTSPLLRS